MIAAHFVIGRVHLAFQLRAGIDEVEQLARVTLVEFSEGEVAAFEADGEAEAEMCTECDCFPCMCDPTLGEP